MSKNCVYKNSKFPYAKPLCAIKKMELQKFNIYKYLKEKEEHSFQKPYFLADQKTFEETKIKFPFRTYTYSISLIYKGDQKVFKIGSRDYLTQSNNLITIGSEIVCDWSKNDNSSHDTIFFSEDLFQEHINLSFLECLSCFKLGGKHVITITDSTLEKFHFLFQALKLLINDQKVVTGIIYSMIMLVRQSHSIDFSSNKKSLKNETLILNFKKLVSKNFIKHKEISYYANELNISSKYLSQILLGYTGKTGKKLISEYIILESKSLLRQTNMSIKEISYQLGFQDASYFSKFFKKNEGNSPYKYRNSQ